MLVTCVNNADNYMNKTLYTECLFGVGTCGNLWCVTNAFGMPNIRALIKSRRRKFMDGLIIIDTGAYSGLIDVMTCDMSCRVVN